MIECQTLQSIEQFADPRTGRVLRVLQYSVNRVAKTFAGVSRRSPMLCFEASQQDLRVCLRGPYSTLSTCDRRDHYDKS